MGIIPGCLGGWSPICSSCMISLCWEIDPIEYMENRQFWDDWECRECNPEYHKRKIPQEN